MNKETKAEAKNIRTSTQTSGTSRASPTSKRYDEALKKAAVENWIPSGQPGTVIAAELGVSYPSRKDWKARDCGDAIPQRDPLAAENRALRRELARVREPQDILKKRGHLQRTGEQRYETIEAMKKEHSLRQLWAAFEVKRCGYLIWGNAPASDRERTDALLMGQSEAGHEQHKGRYGVPRIADELADQGPRPGVKRIARLMKSAGIPGLRPKRFVPQTTDSNHDQPIAPNLLSQAPAPTRPNPTWVTDLTYVRTQEGGLYVAVLLDLWRRRVVGWAAGETWPTSLAKRALTMAIQPRRPGKGLLPHSDRGVQYASGEYREQLKVAGLEASMSRSGNPYDHAAMESFNAPYQRECGGLAEARGGYATRAEATNDFFDYVEKYYNRVRRHSALGYKTPVDFENQLN